MSIFSICRYYDNISDRCQEMPDSTKEIVELIKYLNDASTVQVVTLQQQVTEAAERLQFLLKYANLSCKSRGFILEFRRLLDMKYTAICEASQSSRWVYVPHDKMDTFTDCCKCTYCIYYIQWSHFVFSFF